MRQNIARTNGLPFLTRTPANHAGWTKTCMPIICRKIITGLCLKATLLLLCLTALAARPAPAEEHALGEYQVQAAYILNFIKFSTWPASAFTNDQQDIILGILGEDFFGTTLDAIDGKFIMNRHLQVIRLKRNDNPQGCHLLYISSSENRHLKQILTGIHGKPILTISDMDNFASDGGMIQIKKISGKIQLFVNINALASSGLQLRANLLKIATLVDQ